MFWEFQSRVVVSVRAEQEEAFVESLSASDVPFSLLGEVKGDSMLIDEENFGKVSEAKEAFENALEVYLNS